MVWFVIWMRISFWALFKVCLYYIAAKSVGKWRSWIFPIGQKSDFSLFGKVLTQLLIIVSDIFSLVKCIECINEVAKSLWEGLPSTICTLLVCMAHRKCGKNNQSKVLKAANNLKYCKVLIHCKIWTPWIVEYKAISCRELSSRENKKSTKAGASCDTSLESILQIIMRFNSEFFD